MDIKVETTADFHELVKLNETVQTWHHDSFTDEFKPFDIRALEKAFEKTLQGDNVFAFIARYQNKPIGYLFGYVKTRPDSAFQYEKRYCILTKLLLAKNIRKAESDNY